LVERCQFHAAIGRELRARLPASLAEHCSSCVSHPDRLVVFARSAVWATPLRFALASLLPDLRQTFDVRWQRAHVKILATWQPDLRLRELTLPKAATVAQVEAAAAYSSSEDVHAALLRLARTLRKR
jgi:hypothetical protein